jgi:hypothetical protein
MAIIRSTTVAIIFAVLSVSAQYHELSRAERKSFKSAFLAIQKAYSDSNYSSIVLYAPEILTTYKPILLDPSCVALRPDYLKIDTMYQSIVKSHQENAISDSLSRAFNSRNYFEFLNIYSSVLKQNPQAKAHFGLARASIDSIIVIAEQSNSLFAAYGKLKEYSFFPKSLEDSIRIVLQNRTRNEFFQLSLELNIDKISAFEQKYPELFTSDLMALKQMAMGNLKVSLLRTHDYSALAKHLELFSERDKTEIKNDFRKYTIKSINPDRYRGYFRCFPEKDVAVESSFEEYLYRQTYQLNDYTSGLTYLSMFPQGRYSMWIRDYINKSQVSLTDTTDESSM